MELKKVFWVLSFVFLVNLYHWWWFPRVYALTVFFDLEIVERGLSFLNLVLFGIMLKEYLRPIGEKN